MERLRNEHGLASLAEKLLLLGLLLEQVSARSLHHLQLPRACDTDTLLSG